MGKIEDLTIIFESRKTVIKITSEVPQLFCLATSLINEKIAVLESLGFTKDEVFNLIKKTTAMLSFFYA